MHFIDVIKELIIVLLEGLQKGLKKHKIFAVLFPFVGAVLAATTFIYFDIFKEKIATELFGIAGCFIGTIFVFQVQEITKDGKKINTLKALERNIDTLKVNPSLDGDTEEKIYDLFKEIFTETIKS